MSKGPGGRTKLGEVLLWLLAINLGIALGAGLYEARVVIPRWTTMPPRTWPNTGLQFWVYVTTVPLSLLTIANLFTAWRCRGPARRWHLSAGFIAAAERVATFSYFIPAMVGLMGSGESLEEVRVGLARWSFMNHGRHVLTFAALLCALKTLSSRGLDDP